MISSIEESHIIIHIAPPSIVVDNTGQHRTNNGYIPKTKTLLYDPDNNKTATGNFRSPIIGLAHELTHVEDDLDGGILQVDIKEVYKGNSEQIERLNEREKKAIQNENIVSCSNKAGNAIYFHDGEVNNDPMYAQFNNMVIGFYMVVVPVSSDFWFHDSDGTLVKETRTQLWCTEKTSCYRELNMRFCPETELYYHLYQHASSGSPVPVSNELFARISEDYPITESPEIRKIYDNHGIEGVVAFCRDNGGFEKLMLEDFSVFCYVVTLLWDEGLYVQIDDESGTAYIACGRNPDRERIADLYLHK